MILVGSISAGMKAETMERKGMMGTPQDWELPAPPVSGQHLNISFKAPRFDASGNKVQNARFERVSLNGVVIHENVELTGPTACCCL